MPAEWEKHAATWLGWPHNAGDWPGKFEVIPWVYGEMVRKISAGENIRLIVRHKKDEAFCAPRFQARRRGFAENSIRRASRPTAAGRATPGRSSLKKRNKSKRKPPSSISISTAGPNTTTGARTPRFPKPPPGCSAKNFSTRECPVPASTQNSKFKIQNFVIEGGGIELNGRGTLLSTEECYLRSENPGAQSRPRQKGNRGDAEKLSRRQKYFLARQRAERRRHARPH